MKGNFARGSLVTLIFSLILSLGSTLPAFAWPWSMSAQEKLIQKQAEKNYLFAVSDCFNISNYASIRATGLPRSNERLKAVNSFYIPLVNKLCLKDSSGKYYVNPYHGIPLNSLNNPNYDSYDYELLQAILFDLDYGFTPFTASGTICSDGTFSSSVGRGTCSYHGGYASARGTQVNFTEYRNFPKVKSDEISKLSHLGIHFSTGFPSVMKSSVPAATNLTKGFNCTTATGFKNSCFHFPQFAFSFCSSKNSGELQMNVGKEWKTAWDLAAFKILNNCPSSSPYLFEISGESLVSGQFRVLYKDKTAMLFNISTNL